MIGALKLICPEGIRAMPHADGEATPPVPLVDFDDVAFMTANLCAAVHWYDGSCNCSWIPCTQSQDEPDGPIYDCDPLFGEEQ
jgi:hypothetical protein